MSYYTKITKAGLAAITAAMNNNTKVPITYMAFGDGNGYIPEPDEDASSLVNEVYRVGVNKVEVHSKNPNWLVCEAIIPSAVGGFNIREVALYDNTGNTMLAIASYPPTYKPTLEEGVAKIQTIRIVIQVDNSGNFELIVDPDVVLATIEFVKDIDRKNIKKVESIYELINIIPEDDAVVNLLSYHKQLNTGGDLFIWRKDLSKSLHDGGYIIDPLIPIPSISTFNTYYTPQNTGTGVWVRLNDKQDVHAEAYGLVKLTDDAAAVWSCAAIQQAIKKASVISTTDYHCKTVRISKGRYYTTNPIVLTQNGTFSARLPSLIGGNGKNIFDVELIKTTQNTVGTGFVGGDQDAVIYVSPKTGGSGYVYGEHTSGFTLSRTTIDVGYGYFAQDSVMGHRGNIQAVDHGFNIWTDNCWMSSLGFLRAFKGLKGIAIRGGTSNFGGPLYVDKAKQHGYDFYGLSYSNLNCACDVVGSSLPNGGIGYDFSFTKSVSGTFAIERHKGTEFYFHYSDGAKIAGRSYHSVPVQDSAYKVQVNGGSTYDFDNFSWLSTFANTTEMTPAEIAKYSFSNKLPTSNSSANFENCQFHESFAKNGYVAQLDGKFASNTLDSIYDSRAGVVTHLLAVTTSFKRLCFVGNSAVIELISGNSANPLYNRFFSNPFILTEGAPNTIANLKPNRIMKSAISTDIVTPTNLFSLYENNALTTGYLQGYIDAQGWLCVRSSNIGNNLDYRFVIAT